YIVIYRLQGVSVLGSGVTFGHSVPTTVQIGEITVGVLQDYLRKLIQRILSAGYAGTIIHLNNLELLARNDSTMVSNFFNDIRDILQEPCIYYIFVGSTGMFQETIVPIERVRSIFFGMPVLVRPLTSNDVKMAIKQRYKLLAIRENKWILPIEDELIDNLYEVFSGKIRFVMDAITTLVASLPEGITGTISTSDAKHYLHQLTEQKVKHVLTDAELSVLLQAIQQIQFTNSSLVKATKKTKQNINKYIRQFRKLNFIYQTKKEGRSVYYEVLPDLLLLQNKG
ncbi:MAG: hypothetical protein KAX05_03300, partial [Bacteroidales bacterium]|nr:hypothetical protein [Bacteroidales bacterium]